MHSPETALTWWYAISRSCSRESKRARHPDTGAATTRAQSDAARRRAVEHVLLAYGLMKKTGDVSHNLEMAAATKQLVATGLEQRCDLANWPDIDERFTRTQPDLGFPTPRSEVVHIVRVKYAVLAPRDVNEDSTRHHTGFVARSGRYAHRLAAHRTGWSWGE